MKTLRKAFSWTWGLIRAPYPTAEAVAADGDPRPGLLVFALFTVATMALRSGALKVVAYGKGWHAAYFLRQCGLGTAGLFIGAGLIHLAVRIFGGEAGWRRILAFWPFSYLPTAFFFGGGYLGLIVLRLIYRTWNVVPQPLLLLGWFFAALMLLWKVWLLLTALRVVGNLTIPGVARACFLLAAALFLYWWALWAMGWQRIPYV